MAKSKISVPSGIFTAADYQSLRTARRSLNDLLSKLDKARACGVDCSMYEQMRQDLDAQLAAIEQHFMTPAPTS